MTDKTIETGERFDTAVVGGGLAGLIAAVLLARQGRSVVLLEKARQPGGRAMTTVRGDVHFNLGAHALYVGGDAHRLLTDLQVPVRGAPPSPGTSLSILGNRAYRMPTTLASLLATRLLSIGDKWRLTRFLKSLPTIDTAALQSAPTATWLKDNLGDGPLAGLIASLIRVSTYVSDFQQLSAGSALDQVKLALSDGVLYIDGGWQSLVDGLRDRALELGVTIRTSSHVGSVSRDDEGFAVATTHGIERADSVILAVSPQVACSLLQLPADHGLVEWTARQQPVRAACLDVALSKLPRPNQRFALGADRPLYLSVHSAAAKLAPAGVSVVHVMKYLPSGAVESSGAVEQELEGLLDLVQPGWRDHLLTRRTLPLMTVTQCHPEAGDGGIAGRPPVAVEGFPGIFLAGDWVGSRGQLADAAAASAEEAVSELLARQPVVPVSVLQHV